MSKKKDSIPIFLILFLLIIIILGKFFKIIAIVLGVILGASLICLIGYYIYKKRHSIARFFTHSYKQMSQAINECNEKSLAKHTERQIKIVNKHSSLIRELMELNEDYNLDNIPTLRIYSSKPLNATLNKNDLLQLVSEHYDKIVAFLLASKQSIENYNEYIEKYNALLECACTKENFKKLHVFMKYDTFKEIELLSYYKFKISFHNNNFIEVIYKKSNCDKGLLTIPSYELIPTIKTVFVNETSSFLQELKALNEKYKHCLSPITCHFDLRKYHIQDNTGKINNMLIKKAIGDMISKELSYYSNIKMNLYSNYLEYQNYHKQCIEIISANKDISHIPFLDGITNEEYLELESCLQDDIIVTQNPKDITLTIQHQSLKDKKTIIKDISLLQLITEQEHIEHVKKYSKPYIYAIELNRHYQFYEIKNYTKRISTQSLAAFNNFNKEKYLKKNFSSFYDELSIILSKISSNRELYSEYKFKYSNIPQSKYDEISSYLKSINDLRARDFIKYEKQLIKELELFPQIDFSLNFVVSYVTPKRSHFYEKVETLSYESVKEILNIAKSEKEKETKKTLSKQQIEKKYNYIIEHEKELEEKEIAFKKATQGHIYTTSPSQNSFTPKLDSKDSNSTWTKLKNLKLKYDSGDISFEQYEKERYNILMQEE